MSTETPLTLDRFAPATLEDWRRQVAEHLGSDVGDLDQRTADGVDVGALYTAADRRDAPVLVGPERSGDSGVWSICARVEALAPLEVATEMAEASVDGADAVWLRFDRAARLGIEADAAGVTEHLGSGGAALHHGSDLRVVLEGAALGGVSLANSRVWLEAGGNALPATALFLAACERQGVDPAGIALHCGADPLGALARDGRVPRDLMKLESEMAVLARFSETHLPAGRAITVSTLPYHRAGADIVQELAYAVATLGAYLGALERSGVSIESSAGEIALRLGVGSDLFVEIAKLRAARLLWSMLLSASGLPPDSPAVIHAVGAERTLTRRDPWNNLLRSTGQAFAAVCGGADVLTLLPFDAGLGLPDAQARRLARTTQRVLADEAGLGRVVDPAAGAYCVEALTRQLTERAWTAAQEIEAAGGMRECLLSGRVAREVAESADRRRQAAASGERPITGVTAFARDDERPLDRADVDSEAVRAQSLASLEAHRRNGGAPRAARPVAYSRDFVVDELTAAADAGATVAELAKRLGDGEGAEEIEALPLRRDAERFEGDFGEGARNE